MPQDALFAGRAVMVHIGILHGKMGKVLVLSISLEANCAECGRVFGQQER
jgi:hypothetical protein